MRRPDLSPTAFPGRTQCAAYDANAGMKPMPSSNSTTADYQGRRTPEEIENPGSTGKLVPSHRRHQCPSRDAKHAASFDVLYVRQ
jgi:hypothetical protein